MSKLNFYVGRTVHFAHGYRNVGGREVGGKRVLVFMFHQFDDELMNLKKLTIFPSYQFDA